ncbi:MAG: glutamate racemase [Marinobacter sp.]|uniref:glutamate racemase n=1 Tax=Marinobacter sp. TaxID=50741 RepID=UPI00299CE727|nr:glutamate racemase [Marinobacter sp.]MDX1634071.1 glutamate racemase [Marinobacter sp.]
MKQPQVLVFDSGVGGFSIAAGIRAELPGVELRYLADNAGFPYGDKPEAVVTGRVVSLVRQALAEQPVDLVVIACNTASTVALPSLREAIATPVVGVVPAIKPAAALSANRRIGLLATPATVRRPYLDGLVREFAADCQLTRIGQPDLVHWIEAWVSDPKALPESALAAALVPFREAGVDTVVLGCTHYPLIRAQLQMCLPEVRHWVDSGSAIARRTRHLLEQAGYAALTAATAGPVSAGFTDALPLGLEGFMTRLGLAPGSLTGGWPLAAPVTGAESA